MRRFVVFAMIAVMIFSFSVTAEAATKPDKVKISYVETYDDGTVRIKWTKTAGARTYKVYRSQERNGEYTPVKTTKLKSYTSGSLDNGIWYFKVRAVNGEEYGSYSTPKGVTVHQHEWTPVSEDAEIIVDVEYEIAVCACGQENPDEEHLREHAESNEDYEVTTKTVEDEAHFTENQISGQECSCSETRYTETAHEWTAVYGTGEYTILTDGVRWISLCGNCGADITGGEDVHMTGSCTWYYKDCISEPEFDQKEMKTLKGFECICGEYRDADEAHFHKWEEVFEEVNVPVDVEYEMVVCNCGKENPDVDHLTTHIENGQSADVFKKEIDETVTITEERLKEYACACGKTKNPDTEHTWKPVYKTNEYYTVTAEEQWGEWCSNCGADVRGTAQEHIESNYENGCRGFYEGYKNFTTKTPHEIKTLSHFKCSCGNKNTAR